MRVLNSAQMREADRRTIEDIGIPSLVLMENAGRQAVAAMETMYSDLSERQVAVLCGRGNNGGDGFVVARTLVQRGVDVSVFLLGRVAEVRGDARTNLEILGRLGVNVVVVADSGIPGEILDSVEGPRVDLLTRASMRELIAPRASDSHKGDYGRVTIVAGSRGKTGAAHLAAVGALRSGAGLVTVATPAGCQPVVAAMAPEYMTEALDETDDGLHPAGVDRVLDIARDVIAIGPGLGQTAGTREFIRQ